MNPIAAHRILKILFSWMAGGFLLLTGITNLSDYSTNFQFVQQVSRMEGLFTGDALLWRRVEQSWVHHLFYVCIITMEIGCSILSWLGAWHMWQMRKADASSFEKAGILTTYAYGGAVLLWFGGFVTIAGEWFLIWRSKAAGAQMTAFQLSVIFLLLLVYHVKQDAKNIDQGH